MMESPENPIETPSSSEQERQEELLQAYIDANPEKFAVPEQLLDATPHVAKLEEELDKLEEETSLESLHSITTVSPSEFTLLMDFKKSGFDLATLLTTAELNKNEALLITKREPVVQALRVIHEHLEFLADATNIAIDTLDTLKARYRALSHAVGIISAGVIDHTR